MRKAFSGKVESGFSAERASTRTTAFLSAAPAGARAVASSSSAGSASLFRRSARARRPRAANWSTWLRAAKMVSSASTRSDGHWRSAICPVMIVIVSAATTSRPFTLLHHRSTVAVPSISISRPGTRLAPFSGRTSSNSSWPYGKSDSATPLVAARSAAATAP
jgi:hypothetical protein